MTLDIERMEPRNMPAIALFSIEAPAQVVVGDTFTATVRVAEVDPYLAGLRAVAADITWQHNLVELVDVHLTENLPLFGGSTVFAGKIADLRAGAILSAGAGRAIGDGADEVFAELEFRAVAAGRAVIEPAESESLVLTVPTMRLEGSELRFDAAIVEVLNFCPAFPLDD